MIALRRDKVLIAMAVLHQNWNEVEAKYWQVSCSTDDIRTENIVNLANEESNIT